MRTTTKQTRRFLLAPCLSIALLLGTAPAAASASPDDVNIEIESAKLKRMIDKRAQMFDML